MSTALSLFFAIVGVLLLVCIGISLSYQSASSALLFTFLSVLFVGTGFVLKARRRKKGSR